MIASTGATLNPTAIKDAWQLVVAGSFTICFSGIVAGVVGRVFFRRPEDRRAFRPVGLAIAFPNSAGFPLLLMDALCEQDYIKRHVRGQFECFCWWRVNETKSDRLRSCSSTFGQRQHGAGVRPDLFVDAHTYIFDRRWTLLPEIEGGLHSRVLFAVKSIELIWRLAF